MNIKKKSLHAVAQPRFEKGRGWSSSNTSSTDSLSDSLSSSLPDPVIKSTIETDETKEGERCRKKEKLTIFVWDKINQKSVSLKVEQNFKLKSILKYMIKNPSSKYKYFLIKHQNKETLDPNKSFSHYDIKNKSILILTREIRNIQNKENINTHKANELKNGSKLLYIVCNFGAPYNKKMLSSYHGDVTLNQYAIRIKDKFAMPQSTKITFNFRKKPLLGFQRECGIAQLGIQEKDTIIAQTNGITLTLSVFGTTNNTSLIEMYKYFDLKQLRQQIVSELGIKIGNQKALICKGWRIIDCDNKCAVIKEYETITVLTQCQCHLKENRNLHKIKIKNKNNEKENKYNEKNIDNINNMNENENYLYYLHRSHYKFHGSYGRSPHYKQHPDGRVCKIYRKKVSDQCLHHDNMENEDGRYESSGISDGYHNETFKLCRYGDHCRYFNSPHIFGPCRYYHPPPPIAHHNCSWKSYYSLHHGTTKKNKYRTNYTMIY